MPQKIGELIRHRVKADDLAQVTSGRRTYKAMAQSIPTQTRYRVDLPVYA
jgi:hypothetical protein